MNNPSRVRARNSKQVHSTGTNNPGRIPVHLQLYEVHGALVEPAQIGNAQLSSASRARDSAIGPEPPNGRAKPACPGPNPTLPGHRRLDLDVAEVNAPTATSGDYPRSEFDDLARADSRKRATPA